MIIKRIIIFLCTGIFFLVIWILQSSTFLKISLIDRTKLSSFDILLLMNNSAFGYNSIQAYTLFYTVPFIIFLTMFFLPESTLTIVRTSSRIHFYITRIYQVVISAFLFAMLHMLVNLTFTKIFFKDKSLLNEVGFTSINIYNFVGLFLFFTTVGILFKCLIDISDSIGIAFLFTILLIGGLFFFEKLIMYQSWGPLKDLVVFTKFLRDEWGVKDLLLTYTRQFIIVVISYLIGSFFFVKKDFVDD